MNNDDPELAALLKLQASLEAMTIKHAQLVSDYTQRLSQARDQDALLRMLQEMPTTISLAEAVDVATAFSADTIECAYSWEAVIDRIKQAWKAPN